MAIPLSPDGIAVGPPHASAQIAAIFTVAASLTPASVGAAATAEQTFNPGAFAGILATDNVMLLTAPARTNSILIGSCRVSALGTIAVNYVNPTAGALTPPAGTYAFMVLRAA